VTAKLKAVAPGPFVTLQDDGRHGWKRFGVPVSGAMDVDAMAVANALVGNPPGHAAIEFAHAGGEWEIAAPSCRIAVTGGSFALAAGGSRIAPYQSHTLTRGQRLSVGGTKDAVWGYLAVAGGFDLRPQLSSLSTHPRSGLGGLHGRLLSAGDEIPLRIAHAPEGHEHRFANAEAPRRRLRVVPGPQDCHFTPASVAAFLGSGYQVTNQCDRQGYRLAGQALEHRDGHDNIVSDAPVPGCVQVPGAGQPIVLLMDCQTIGGYPKIATVIKPDLGHLAQCRPGTTVTFEAVGVARAQRLHRVWRAMLETVPDNIETVAPRTGRAFWLLK